VSDPSGVLRWPADARLNDREDFWG